MWRIGVDSGGTFTDICLVDEVSGDGRVWKVPSTPEDPSQAMAQGVVEGLAEAAGDSPAAFGYFGRGITVDTNALIQHRGAPTGLLTTAGFRDLLKIVHERRPHLYDLQADCNPGIPAPVTARGFLGPGQSMAMIAPGAGGYGNPRERDRALVRRDLAEGVISEHVAREVYGLADSPDTRAVARLGGT